MLIISQPRYLPALNYIQRLYFADEFMLLDTVQRQSRGWENRNKLLLPEPKWLTIPIASSSREMISKTEIHTFDWLEQHAIQIKQNYRKTAFYDEDILMHFYKGLEKKFGHSNKALFTDVIEFSLTLISEILNCSFKITRASDYMPDDPQTGPCKIFDLSKASKTDCYVSGPNGKEYGIEEAFDGGGIKLLYHSYDHPVYPQCEKIKFQPYMGFFDAIFYMGLDQVKKEIFQPPLLLPGLNSDV